jgi:hypothetical protein
MLAINLPRHAVKEDLLGFWTATDDPQRMYLRCILQISVKSSGMQVVACGYCGNHVGPARRQCYNTGGWKIVTNRFINSPFIHHNQST